MTSKSNTPIKQDLLIDLLLLAATKAREKENKAIARRYSAQSALEKRQKPSLELKEFLTECEADVQRARALTKLAIYLLKNESMRAIIEHVKL